MTPRFHSREMGRMVIPFPEIMNIGGRALGLRGRDEKFIFFFLIYLFLAVLSLRCCVRGLSLVEASGDYSSLWCTGFSLRWPLLLRSTGSRHPGFSSCSTRAQ